MGLWINSNIVIINFMIFIVQFYINYLEYYFAEHLIPQLVVELGSLVAMALGFQTFVEGNGVVGNSGLLVGIAGIVTALVPIRQAWIASMLAERREKFERNQMRDAMHANSFAVRTADPTEKRLPTPLNTSEVCPTK
jgi:hypothetical protein